MEPIMFIARAKELINKYLEEDLKETNIDKVLMLKDALALLEVAIERLLERST